MSFRHVFIAVAIAFSLVLAGFLINRSRPKTETEQAGGDFVRATGKCAECHSRTQYSVVHEYEMSKQCPEGRELPGLSSGGFGTREKRPSRFCDFGRSSDSRQLSGLP